MSALPLGVVWALARRPDLWTAAVRVGWRTAPPGWWRRRPRRPWPDPGYLRFRLETMYGPSARWPGTSPVTGPDLVRYLDWCRRVPRGSR